MFNVLLLAAGYATRLYPLTENFPKPLLKVAGRPMLDHLLDHLLPIKDQVGEIVCVTNDRFYAEFVKWQKTLPFPFEIKIVNDGSTTNDNRLGAIGDIQLALQNFKETRDTVILAGDNIFNFDLVKFFRTASKRDGATLASIDVGDRELAKRYGILKLDASGRITQFLEKPQDPPSTLASTGIYYFPKAILNFFDMFLKEGGTSKDAPGFYIGWLVGRAPVYGESLKGVWYDIGDLKSLNEADRVFLNLKGEKKK